MSAACRTLDKLHTQKSRLALSLGALCLLLTMATGCPDDETPADGVDAGASDAAGRDGSQSDGATDDGCLTGSACTRGLVCDPNLDRCVASCDDDSGCAETERCNQGTGVCEARTRCTDPSPCGDQEVCNTCLGVCVDSTGGAACVTDTNCPNLDQFCDSCIQQCQEAGGFCDPCTQDSECGEPRDHCITYSDGGVFCGLECGSGRACPAGASCDTELGQCVPINTTCLELSPCEDDAACRGAQICSDTGVCIDGCTEDGVCPGTEVCTGGRCALPCSVNTDCEDPAAECDDDGHCRIPGSCVTSWDCPMAEMHCDRELAMCAEGCEVDDDCRTFTLECSDGECIRRACRGAYVCGFGQVCSAASGECEEPTEPHCDMCNGDDTESCGAGNLCANLQDADGNDKGAFCWIACSDDPLNVCPQGYQCSEIEVPTQGGGSEMRMLCTRACFSQPI